MLHVPYRIDGLTNSSIAYSLANGNAVLSSILLVEAVMTLAVEVNGNIPSEVFEPLPGARRFP